MAIAKYKTIADFRLEGNVSDVNSLLYSVRDSIPFFNPFFIILFGIFLVFTISSYYAQIKIIGNQKFFNSMLAGGFSTFLISMLFSLVELVTPLHVFTFIAISLIAFILASFYRD